MAMMPDFDKLSTHDQDPIARMLFFYCLNRPKWL